MTQIAVKRREVRLRYGEVRENSQEGGDWARRTPVSSAGGGGRITKRHRSSGKAFMGHCKSGRDGILRTEDRGQKSSQGAKCAQETFANTFNRSKMTLIGP